MTEYHHLAIIFWPTFSFCKMYVGMLAICRSSCVVDNIDFVVFCRADNKLCIRNQMYAYQDRACVVNYKPSKLFLKNFVGFCKNDVFFLHLNKMDFQLFRDRNRWKNYLYWKSEYIVFFEVSFFIII